MKKIVFSLMLGFSLTAFAQDYSVPAASPRQKVEQQFSLSKVSIDYGRPAVKGRKVFGDLVPFGKVWRAGANSATKITFGQNVNFGGKDIAAGTYGLFIVPEANSWKLILNKDSQAWGAYTFDEKLNVLDVTVPVQKSTTKQEFFQIALNPSDENTLNFVITWDNALVEVPVKVAKPEVVKKMVEQLQEVKKTEREGNKK